MQTNNKQQTTNNPKQSKQCKQQTNTKKILSERTIKAKVNQKQRKNKPKLNNNNEKQQQQKETTKISGHTRGQSGTVYALTQIHTHRHNTNVVRK